MKKFIHSQFKKIILAFILLVNTNNALSADCTSPEISEIACASLGMISGLAANNIQDQDSLKAAKFHIIHDLINLISDCITIYNDANKTTKFLSKFGYSYTVYNGKTNIFIWELLTLDATSLFAEVKNYIKLKKKKKVMINNDPDLEFELEEKTPTEPSVQPHIVKMLKIVLPLAQGAARIAASLDNDGVEKLDCLKHENLQGIAVIAMLTELLTKTKSKSIQNGIAILIILNSIKIYNTFASYNAEKDNISRQHIHEAQENLAKLRQTLQETQRTHRQEYNQLNGKLHRMAANVFASYQQLTQLDDLRKKAEAELKNAKVAVKEEHMARTRAENAIRESGENRRHELFGLGKNATQEEIKAAYEALLSENAIPVDD